MPDAKALVSELEEIADVQDVTTDEGDVTAVTLVGEGGYRVRIAAEYVSEWSNGHQRIIPRLVISKA